MYCKKCKTEFKVGKFCPRCGEKLIDYDEYEKKVMLDENEYDETVRQVKEKAMKAAGVAMSFGKALTNYAKKATNEFIENSQNGNLQKSFENKFEKMTNGGNNTKKSMEATEDYGALKKKLQTLKEMKDEGLLSTEEYEEKRNTLLNKENPVKKKEKKEVKREEKINKCPNCGEIVNAFDVKCSTCGFELRGKKMSSMLDDFSDRMDDIDNELKERNDNVHHYFDFSGISEKEKITNASIAEQQKVEYIKNTPIPNTKEDIVEFMILASSNIDTSSGKLAGAWLSKMEQAYQKARILLKDDSSFPQIEEMYQEKVKKIKEAQDKAMKKMKIEFAVGLIITLLIFFGPVLLLLFAFR